MKQKPPSQIKFNPWFLLMCLVTLAFWAGVASWVMR